MRRPFLSRSIVIFFSLAALLLSTLAIAGGATAATTIGPTTTCSNDYQADVAGLGIVCEVTVVNTITASGGSATVTVHECHGPAGPVPVQTDCTTQTTSLGEPVTAVTQCNGSINGGGTTLRCSVLVTNNFVGVAPGETPVSVNQCVGSAGGGGTAMVCDPFPANTIGAAITQCNGTASGGGGSLTCTASGMMASANAVTINQCNGSSNGNGDLVICSANITNNVVSVTPTPTPTATPTTGTPTTGTGGSTPTAPPTDLAVAPADVVPVGPSVLLFIAIGLLVALSAAFAAFGGRRSRQTADR